jgi:hypothetical protein
MRWLMKWLHPDRERSGWESALAERVSSAWQDLKSRDRRGEYDRLHPRGKSEAHRRSSRRDSRRPRPRIPWIGGPLQVKPTPSARGHRVAVLVAVGAAALAALLLPAWAPQWPWRTQAEPQYEFRAESGIDAAAVDTTPGGSTDSLADDQ